MFTWICKECGQENSETGTCGQCGHIASKAELAFARQRAYTQRRFPRGLPRLGTSVGFAHFVSTMLVVSGILFLAAMIPGAVAVTCTPPSGSGGSSVITPKKAKAASYIFTVKTPGGLAGLLDPGISGRTYVFHTRNFVPTQISVPGSRYTIARRSARYVGAATEIQPSKHAVPARGFVLRTLRGYPLETIPAETANGATRVVFRVGTKQTVMAGRSVSIDTPLRSSGWSMPTLAIGAVLLAALGYLTIGRMAARHLAATAMAMIVGLIGLRLIEKLTLRLMGNLAIRSDYPMVVPILVPLAALVAACLVVGFTFRFTHERLYFLTRENEITVHTWLLTKGIALLLLPPSIYLIVRSVDTFISAMAPGLTL